MRTAKNITTTDIGRFGEDAASKYIQKHGFRILERNFRSGHNEIDIIAENKNFVVFFEVKTRTANPLSNGYYGVPSTAVTYSKQRRTIEAARAYLYMKDVKKQPRFDVIEVYLSKTPLSANHVVEKIEHMESAFIAR